MDRRSHRQQSSIKIMNPDLEPDRYRFKLWLCHLLLVSLSEATYLLFIYPCPSLSNGGGLGEGLNEKVYVEHSAIVPGL